jgi:hypothetical protein
MKFFIFLISLFLSFISVNAQNLSIISENEYPSFAKNILKQNDLHPENWVAHVFFNQISTNNYIEESYLGTVAIHDAKNNLIILKLDNKIVSIKVPKVFLNGHKLIYNDYTISFSFGMRVNPDGPYDGIILISKNGKTKKYFSVLE